jgi:hypothetical protein
MQSVTVVATRRSGDFSTLFLVGITLAWLVGYRRRPV